MIIAVVKASMADIKEGTFLGSAAMGLLYDKSILAVVLLSVIFQIAALPVLYIANKSR